MYIAIVPMAQYFFVIYHSKWENKITHDLFCKDCPLLQWFLNITEFRIAWDFY